MNSNRYLITCGVGPCLVALFAPQLESVSARRQVSEGHPIISIRIVPYSFGTFYHIGIVGIVLLRKVWCGKQKSDRAGWIIEVECTLGIGRQDLGIPFFRLAFQCFARNDLHGYPL